MSAPSHDLLHLPLVFLGAAVLAVPLARWARLGSILGYLVAGVLIGPQVLGLVSAPETILEVAEIGVVLMMFLVGLELEPRRLWQLRRPIFGWGSVQLLGSTALLMALALLCGLPWRLALVGSLGLAMSSTAVAMAVLGERNLGGTAAGQSILSVALLQDIAAIPILALVPALAGADGSGSEGHWQALKALGAIAVLILGGRLALRPALRWIAGSATPEIFTAAALLLVLATAALMQAVGLSMALGAFLAGVLLAESEYRHELETDLEPFKGLLLGLFFIAVGMGLDLQVLLQQPGLVAALLAGLLLLKGALLLGMGRVMGLPLLERPVFVILLAQGGEFGFVVFQLGQQAGLLSDAQASALVAAVALSLGCTPALLAAADRWLQPRLALRGGPAMEELKEPQQAPVIIAGFGRYGQIVGRLLYANGHEATVLEHDAHTVEGLRRFDWRVFYGDATRLDLLRTAGAETAAILVIAVDDVAQSLAIAELAREHFPQLQIVARARNVQHFYRLQELGVQHVERETFESALLSGRSVLELLGVEPAMARRQAWRFRQHNAAQLRLMARHRDDEDQLIAMVKQGRQQLETLMAQEREARAQVRHRQGWNPGEAEDARPD
ncbi:glutathione-regulated potassium-efflux system protein KefC [Pelomonas sp. BJYL3]|uniref:glutathione-regulated potassium-efflux system protein KefC n=1 Tax=Pelomonas sp. BJYL3 TaxID=2976697 RepID=UPI0022B4A962|nr:glutathione-regulated potassium-efflux system protein KefC [Pelomonas sp. BJYL3]